MKAVVGMCNSTLFGFSAEGRRTPADVASSFTELALKGLTAP